MAKTGHVLAALLGGAVVGAVAALLLAPKSGAETREQIMKIAREQGAKLNREELEALCSRVIAKLKDYFSDDELVAAVEEELDKAEEAKA